MSRSWGILPLLADKSAWARVRHRIGDWEAALADKRIVICDVVALELLYSARTRQDVLDLHAELSGLRSLPVTRSTTTSAVRAMIELTRIGADGHHRVAPADALIGACAAEQGCAVLHYDAHYDRLGEVLGFDSVWMAAPGSIP